MAGFGDTLRGDGLIKAQRALVGLEGDPERLDRARRRFSDSPPPYTSDRSGTETRSVSPNPLSEDQRHRQERRMQLAGEREESKPHKQFSAQVEEERRRIWNADGRTSWIKINPGDGTFKKEACETVKKHWVEQGIWSNKWNQFAYGRWKHEEPLELESESETDLKAGPFPPLFSFISKSQPKPSWPKSDDEKRRIAEQRVVQDREREASRPYYQFVYQISKERERIQEACANGAADINTRAYKNIRNTWTRRGIWNRRWEILPGMSWKHEEPLEVAPVSASHAAGEASTRRLFESPPIESDYRQVSGAFNSSQQGPPAHISSAGLQIHDAERSSFTHSLRPSRKKPTHKDGPPGASLGPIHSSKVSKAAGKKRPGPKRQPNISQKVSSGSVL